MKAFAEGEANAGVTFHPGHVQFVLYDVAARRATGADDPLWGRPDETDAVLSVRGTEVAVGLLDDAEVSVTLSWHDLRPTRVPEGAWEVEGEASLTVASGQLGVRDVVEEEAVLVLEVPPGRLGVRAFGRFDGEQVFRVQVWPHPEG